MVRSVPSLGTTGHAPSVLTTISHRCHDRCDDCVLRTIRLISNRLAANNHIPHKPTSATAIMLVPVNWCVRSTSSIVQWSLTAAGLHAQHWATRRPVCIRNACWRQSTSSVLCELRNNWTYPWCFRWTGTYYEGPNAANVDYHLRFGSDGGVGGDGRGNDGRFIVSMCTWRLTPAVCGLLC